MVHVDQKKQTRPYMTRLVLGGCQKQVQTPLVVWEIEKLKIKNQITVETFINLPVLSEHRQFFEVSEITRMGSSLILIFVFRNKLEQVAF